MRKRTAAILTAVTLLSLGGYVAWCSRAFYMEPLPPDFSAVPEEVKAMLTAALESEGMAGPSEFDTRQWNGQLCRPHESSRVTMVVNRMLDAVQLHRSDGRGTRVTFIRHAGVWRQVGEKEFSEFWFQGGIDVSPSEKETESPEPVSFHVIRANWESYLDKEVVVSGYLKTHEEGPCIGSDPGDTVVRILHLEIQKGAEIASKDPAEVRNWYHYVEGGFPAFTTGILRRHPDADGTDPNRRKFYLEVSSAREVDPADPGWQSFLKK